MILRKLGFLLAAWVLAGFGVAGRAAEPAGNRDTLVFKDGDRLHGAVVRRTPEEIVFRSDRFGEVRVKAADAVIIPAVVPAAKPAVAAVETKPNPVPAAAPVHGRDAYTADEERLTLWDRFSPSVLTARVRSFMGPWNGRMSVASEVVSDVTDRDTLAVETNLSRKWTNNEVQLSARYDYAETDEVPTTDILKTAGSWRHEFTKARFAQYRPSFEINRASRLRGVPNDYMLLQQEIGVGLQLSTRPTRKVRVGVAQNLFDLWKTTGEEEHSSRGVQSAFEEIELKLPWRMGLTQRGVWYPVNGDTDGFENRIELNKKLTETLSAALRHEIRRDNPDGNAQDYTRLRVMFGLDF